MEFIAPSIDLLSELIPSKIMSSLLTRQRSTESASEAKDLGTQSSVLPSSVDVVMDDRPVFCLNEEERKTKTFHERKTDLDAAIEWIVKEIVSDSLLLNMRPKNNLVKRKIS